MNDTETKLNQARDIILSACRILQHCREVTPVCGREIYASSADCYVLLHDATRLFCHYLSEVYHEPDGKRWSPVLPELLLSHPDRCYETLARVEQKEFKELSYFQFVAA